MIGEMWASMAPTGKVVIAVLCLLSIYSLSVVVERLAALRWSSRQSKAFAEEVGAGTDIEAMLAAADTPERQQFPSLASVVARGLHEFLRVRDEGQRGDVIVESVEEATAHGLDVAMVNLRARLTSMATIAGIAPFFGLFGTVTGLIAAFRGIAATGGGGLAATTTGGGGLATTTGDGGLAAVSAGVSEALVTTVVGLFVAMPALWAYNFLMNRVDVMGIELDNGARRLLGGLIRSQARPTGEYLPRDRRGRRSADERPKVSALPDITPIVNVALVLLIIFMIVTPMIREGIQIDTPEAEAVAQLSESDQSVVLSIRDDGSMFVNLKPVQSASLSGELALAYRGSEGKAVVIKGSQNLPYSDILAVMDVCKSIGAPSVDLVAAKVR